jgi:hypothetical protein
MADQLSHVHDPVLGYVPRPGHREPGLTIEDDSLRSTGRAQVTSVAPILAVGDSFTFGQDVGDAEAWPAQLQKLTGRRVLNGGVSGYGFDQIVLRAEQLATMYKPSVIIVSFIADDVRRNEMSRLFWHDKPWFAIEGDRLVLKGTPVPNHAWLSLRMQQRLARFVIRLPYTVCLLMGYHARALPGGTGLEVARRLVGRLAALQRDSCKVILLAQYDPFVWQDRSLSHKQRLIVQSLADCAARNGLVVVDSYRRLATEPDPVKFYTGYHMNPRGNSMIAGLLAAAVPELRAERVRQA